MLRIAVSGSHGVGKTTLIEAVAATIAPTRRAAVCREAARRLIEITGDPGFVRRDQSNPLRQALIFLQHNAEEFRSRVGADVLISDRTLVDHLAYTYLGFPEVLQTVEGSLLQRLAFETAHQYDLIFLAPVEFPLHEDGVREPDLRFQADVAAQIVCLYTQAEITPIEIRGSMEERIREIMRHLNEAWDMLAFEDQSLDACPGDNLDV